MTLTFTPFVTALPGLPENFLPAAFAHLAAPDTDSGHQVFEIPDFAETRLVSGQVLADAAKLPQQFPMLAPMAGAAPPLRYLGPPVAPRDDAAAMVLGAGPELPLPVFAPLAIGIIDSGIAFWNPAFRVTRDAAPEPAFSGMLMQEFSPVGQGAPRTSVLDKGQVAAICGLAAQPGGDRLVRAALGRDYPGTVFGSSRPGGPVARPGGLAHGTAMAGLVLEHAQGRVPRLFGCELPLEAVADSGGDTLQCLLALSIRNLVAAIKAHPAHEQGVDIVILAALAFTGGPQHPAHPFLGMLDRLLADLKHPNLRLIVPRGNHLQEQGHARIASGSAPQVWHLPPDDHSSNTLECAFADGEDVALTLTAPDGRSAGTRLGPGDVALLRDGGRVIGAAWRKPAAGGFGRLRLTLAQTAGGGGRIGLSPAGDWRLALQTDPAGDIELWVLRDDMPLDLPGLPPRRRSWLGDQGYRRFDDWGRRAKTDLAGTGSRVLRAGTASLLSCAGAPVEAVTALEQLGAGTPEPAVYAGLPQAAAASAQETVDRGRQGAGQWVIGDGGGRRFRLSGTSVAAAIHAGRTA